MLNVSVTQSRSIKATLSLFRLIIMVTIFSLTGLTQRAVAQSTSLPMEISLEDRGVFFLTVPDEDVSASAYGGKLRRRDVHVAKMFEVTQHFCQTEPSRASTYIWIYRKNGGNARLPGTDRGTFEISCNLANDIALAYGAGEPESTTVGFCRGGGACSPQTYSIPILNITGGKVDTWLRFMSNFKPVR
jgi:hypothetical protein